MRRTALRDIEFGGKAIRQGDKVLMWYVSGNRDEEVFDDPFRFDVGRDPNKHLAFGYGVHFCLGAALARLEGRVALDEVLSRFPEWEVDLPHVFERFYRRSESRKQEGFGLGLAIATELAQRMDGSIAISSSRRFTAFTLELPQARPTAAAPANCSPYFFSVLTLTVVAGWWVVALAIAAS